MEFFMFIVRYMTNYLVLSKKTTYLCVANLLKPYGCSVLGGAVGQYCLGCC
jgi:hypothetical protein